jgi:hypothetical protein
MSKENTALSLQTQASGSQQYGYSESQAAQIRKMQEVIENGG